MELHTKRHAYNFKHGGYQTRLYGIWKNMRARCSNENGREWDNYGGRGIRVCTEWADFSNFRDWAVKNGYADDLSIDRINNDGNYRPANCRWTTIKEQGNNKRNNVFWELNGRKQTLTQWADEIRVSVRTLRWRLKNGWRVEETLNTYTRDMTNSNKAIILAVEHGYRGGWHAPDSEVFKDEEFWRAVAKGLEYHEWRTLYEKYLVADSNEITDEAFWKAEFIALKNL